VPIAQVPSERPMVFYAHSRYFPDGKFSKYALTPDGWRLAETIAVRE